MSRRQFRELQYVKSADICETVTRLRSVCHNAICKIVEIAAFRMLFTFIFALLPLLVTAGLAVPNANGKVTQNFKLESWMLKPLSPSDEHFKPPSKSVSSYVDQSTYWLSTVYFSSTYCSTDEIIMKTAFPTGTCIQSDDPTDSFSSVSVYCYSGNSFHPWTPLFNSRLQFLYGLVFYICRIHVLLLYIHRLELWYVSDQLLSEPEHVPGRRC